jgi:hypothetical protein
MAGGRWPQEQVKDSDVLELGDGPFVSDVSGIQSGFRFDKNNVNFLVCDGAVFHAARDDDEFPFSHDGFVVAELHPQGSFDDEKQLILVFMMVPDEFALELHGFDVAVIHFAEDARVAVIGKAAEFFFQINGVHVMTYRL